jgi:hypothetical protein
MAQVRFYSMRLSFQKLRDLLTQYNSDRFANLIFQAQNPDAPRDRDEYDLIAYVVAADGSATYVLQGAEGDGALIRDTDIDPLRKHARRIALANYPLSRARIQGYVDAGGNLVEYLLLQPQDFANDDRYVFYTITPKNSQGSLVGAAFDDNELNPCPPNQPG